MSGYIGNIPTPQATQTRDVFTATAGQTSFATSGYTPGFLDVYLNGVHLVNGTDYTASNGSDVVLTSGATAGDNVEVVAYTTFEVLNQSFSGNFSVDSPTFVVDATNNRVGVGTSSPQVLMHGQSSDARLWLERPSGSHIEVGAGASSAFVYNRANAPLLFGTNNTERVRISSDGFQRNNVAAVVSSGQESAFYSGGDGVGLYNANAYSGCGAHIEVGNDATSGWANIYLHRTWNTGEDTRQIAFYVNGSGVGSIDSTTTGTSYNTSSDYRLKENVVPLSGAADRLAQIPVHRFNFIADPETTVDGFLAHEVQAFVPECVTGTKDQVATVEIKDEDGNVIRTEERPVYQGIDQSKLVPLLTAALQEALADIATLKAEVAALKGEPA